MDASTLKPAEVAVYFLKQGDAKHRDRYEYVFLKAVLAGVMLSFGGLLSEVISGGSPGLTSSNPGIVKILGGFVFPVGLVMIVLQGQELLTSNMMVFPMAVLKGVIPWWSLPLNWIIVFFGNLVGSLFFGAILVHYSGILSAEPYASFVKSFAIHKASDPQWHQIFLRGIGCNWLVCIAVWQAAGAKDTISKIYAIWLPIWLFVACSFDHVVANMFSVPLGIMFGADLTVAEYIRKSLIASLIGNIVGALFVALPATYFYLQDYDVGGLRSAEAGEVVQQDHSSGGTEEKIR
ncbi:putative formate/nitrite transporter [Mycena belliarum]|uniref:Formate/nitrite transporter n=1 Tax=Mycena belliarum TaxID=1033014 RepID=A0AAD6U3J9_9AGAR|nr:putative formate/nitrite transporter [Mycena belliae]